LAIETKSVHDPYYPLPKYKKIFLKGKKGKIIESEEELKKALYYKIINMLKNPYSSIYNIFDKDIIEAHKELFTGKYKEEKLTKIERLIPPKKGYKLAQLKQRLYYNRINIDDKSNLEYLKSLYDACILGVDQELIKPILSMLKKLNIYNNTIIVITSEHGEEFNEHGGLCHGMKFYDELIHVPLIIKIPHYKRGKRIKALVQSIDIMPTIFEIIGVTIPHYVQGKSFYALIKNRKINSIHKYVYGYNNEFSYLRSLKWKLIIHNNSNYVELYNLKKDPGEKRNIYSSNSNSKIVNMMLVKLLKWLYTLPVYKEKENEFLPNIDKKTQEKIKKTGYW
jgi:arylsulfatase A-like enzyme